MHPLLVPSSWLVDGRYFPRGRGAQRVIGLTEVHASEQFPETLRVDGEVRDADDPTSRPVSSGFHLDVSGPETVRFRMDSLPLGTVLVGDGNHDDVTLILRYASPDRRIFGSETFIALSPSELRTSGVMFADGVAVTSWLARLERVSR